MKAIILAAGQGSRLRPLTDKKPKCMVEYNGRAIIDYILDAMHGCEIQNIAIANGYKADVLTDYLKDETLTFYTNKNFDKTNMVSTLFCAKEFMDDDLIISYADIVYGKETLDKLISSKNDFSVVVDRKWRDLWNQRMENPLQDAETLKIQNSKIIELGKKPSTYEDIEGQYIGLMKISKRVIHGVVEYYQGLDTNASYDSQSFDNMYMTSFIQMIIDNLLDVKPIFIDGGWVEIDSISDLKCKPQ
ncbi:MAG: phosphocholine cytidylyltransferase family protein [Sulfurimonas denitrificans]|nr:phosphocholine cytidylyltransferase family protein [Sulfurimonas denitrificans]